MRTMFVCLALVLSALPATAGERAKNPGEAVVFIRLTGSVHAEIEELGQRRSLDRDRIELGTGSGFLISPDGYILTNHHVIEPADIVLTEGLLKATLALKPTRIEACLSREMVEARGAASQCFEASVAAADPTLDLAVLSIGGSSLPYIALGDSDTVTSGQPTQALGYPFGRLLQLEGNGANRREPVPELSTSAGTISAIRSAENQRRSLQINSTVNPGNSGGPLVDKDGFAVGVIRARLADTTGIAFAIPVNQAKALLEARGFDHLMPSRALRLGPLSTFEVKGLALRLPEGFNDTSPLRQRIEAAAASGEVTLRVDRILSPFSLKQVEQQLIATQAFERLSQASATDSRTLSRPSGPPTLLGQQTAIATDSSTDTRMIYAIVDLGREKLLARFVGTPEQVAFSESVLRASLASLEGRPLISGDASTSPPAKWSHAVAADSRPLAPFPAGWVLEPGSPTACRGLAAFDMQGAAMPSNDFTLVLRVGVWNAATMMLDDVAAACSSRRGSLGTASYVLRADWMGVSYAIEGIFVRTGPQRIMQMEVLSTDSNAAFARALLAEWVKQSMN